jgi:hypothetical protein
MQRTVNNFYYTLISFIDNNLLWKAIGNHRKIGPVYILGQKYNINILAWGGRCTHCTHPASFQHEGGLAYSPSPLALPLSSRRYPHHLRTAPARSSSSFHSRLAGMLADRSP